MTSVRGFNTGVQPTETALIVAVPEAERLVAPLRARLDTSASWGVPAHISVTYPFLPPERIDEEVLAAVRQTVAAVPRFTLRLTGTSWFGEQVLWLAPDPAGPFRQLTARLWARFPEAPPYGGEIADVVPHLTVGHDHPRGTLQAAAAEIQPHLPIRAEVSAVWLIAGRPEPGDSWYAVAEFPLG